MALRDLNFSASRVATATVATTATVAPVPALDVAKVATVAVAEPEDSKNVSDPKALCLACTGGQYWQPQEGGAWHCQRCEPDMPATATTLTMACHQPPPPPLVRTHAHLDPLLECACEGLSITAEQLRQALEDTDLQALATGELTLKALRLTAWTLALAHHGLPDRRTEKRRREGLSLLAEHPGITYAMTSHTELEADAVIVTLAVRGKATCELRVPKDRYDGFALLELLGRTNQGHKRRHADPRQACAEILD